MVMLCLSYIIAIVDPLQKIIENQVTMRPGSFLYNLWEKPPLDVLMKVYLFNITNGDAFINGVDKKLKVVEIGPYVYQEFLENRNATFNDNGTISFVPVRHSVFMPELSVGDPTKDIIYAANLPLLGLSAAASKISSFASLAISALVTTTNSRPILNLTVHDFLWGYEDNLVRFANNIVPDFITFERFGLMDRLFDEGHNVVTLNLPESVANLKRQKEKQLKEQENINKHINEPIEELPISLALTNIDVEYEDDYVQEDENMFNGIASMSHQTALIKPTDAEPIRDFSIDNWNGSPGLKNWGYNEDNPEGNNRCNTLRGSYDGTLFPKNLSKTETFKIFRKAFCRTIGLHYSHSGKQYGIEAYWFSLPENAFDDHLDDPETQCYCGNDKICMKRGLGNITPCYYNIPVSVSLPHFYSADPTLLHEVEGLNPVKEKHESIVIMQPKLGVPIKMNSRIQLNLMTGETQFNSDVKPFDNLALPVFWMELTIEKLTFRLIFILKMAFNILPVVQNAIICLLIFTGFLCLAGALANFFYFDISSEQSDVNFDPRKSIRYTAVFPYIKMEIAKFEDRGCEAIQKMETV